MILEILTGFKELWEMKGFKVPCGCDNPRPEFYRYGCAFPNPITGIPEIHYSLWNCKNCGKGFHVPENPSNKNGVSTNEMAVFSLIQTLLEFERKKEL